jgi:hypothetical protein
MSDRESSFAQSDVVVVALVPFPSDTNPVGHLMHLVFRVRDHVAHDHPSERRAHIIDVNGHEMQPMGLSGLSIVKSMRLRVNNARLIGDVDALCPLPPRTSAFGLWRPYEGSQNLQE